MYKLHFFRIIINNNMHYDKWADGLKSRFLRILYNYTRENWTIIILLLIFFVVGIAIGSISSVNLNEAQRKDLNVYVNNLFQQSSSTISQFEIFKLNFLNYLKLILILWLLGITVIGIPIILLIITYKGFTTGFSIGFLFSSFNNVKSILFIIYSVLPQSLLLIPFLIFLCISGIKFSLFLIKEKDQRKLKPYDIKMKAAFHTLISVLAITFSIITALVESIILSTLV